MKKICGAFLAILMLGCFIGCNNNPSGDFSSKDDSLLGEITYTKPILPESVGKDPFEGLTELVNDSDKKFLVNTELKTISSCDSEGNISTEYEYSYKNTDDGVILSVVISKESMDNELVPVEDIVNNYANTELLLENYVKDYITYTFDNYNEYFDNEDFLSDYWPKMIEDVNLDFGTSFTKDSFTCENYDWIVEQCINPRAKEFVLLRAHNHVNHFSLIYNYKINITNTNGTQADFAYEGIYDESKKWYDQSSVFFYDEDWIVVIYPGVRYINKDIVISIDDSSIKTFYYDENNIKQYKTYSYIKTGSGYDSVIYITIDGTVVDVKPHSTDMFNWDKIF